MATHTKTVSLTDLQQNILKNDLYSDTDNAGLDEWIQAAVDGKLNNSWKRFQTEWTTKLMNDSDFGLTASIWTREAEVVRLLGAQINTGTVFMNRCDYLDPAMAWTGVKNTGRGVTLSGLGYDHLTRPKSFHLKMA